MLGGRDGHRAVSSNAGANSPILEVCEDVALELIGQLPEMALELLGFQHLRRSYEVDFATHGRCPIKEIAESGKIVTVVFWFVEKDAHPGIVPKSVPGPRAVLANKTPYHSSKPAKRA